MAQSIQLVDESKLPRFEVASVKPGDPKADRATIGTPPGRFIQENMQENMEWMNRVVGNRHEPDEPQLKIEEINAFLVKYARKG